jgi:serine protease inhibitor
MKHPKSDQELNSQLVGAINRFGFNLLRELAGAAPTENLLISPASVSAALSMTYNGAAGETTTAMAEALCLDDLSLDDLNRAHAALWAALAQADPQVTFEVANSLWAKTGIPFLPDFMARNREFYGAEVANLDFADPQATDIINAWVNNQTHGKIADIVEPPIEPLTILFLINALYFKGQWSNQFNVAATKPGVFHLLDGRGKSCPMMTRSDTYPYMEGPGFQAISLPYGAGRFSLCVFLPAAELGLAGFLERLAHEGLGAWTEWMEGFWKRDGSITLPRFKVAYSKSLNEALKALGMAVAFGDTADFRAMSPLGEDPGISIADVLHKTFMEVNEEGTVAAAVTKVEMAGRCIPPPPFKMVVDRPFFCAIRDNETGVIVFAGVVVDPE